MKLDAQSFTLYTPVMHSYASVKIATVSTKTGARFTATNSALPVPILYLLKKLTYYFFNIFLIKNLMCKILSKFYINLSYIIIKP